MLYNRGTEKCLDRGSRRNFFKALAVPVLTQCVWDNLENGNWESESQPWIFSNKPVYCNGIVRWSVVVVSELDTRHAMGI